MSDCACVTGSYDGNGPDWPERRQICTARKSHVCGECGASIAPGERYEYIAGSWEGRFSTHKTCAACREIREALFCDGDYCFGMIWDDIRDCLPTITVPCLEQLTTAAAKEKLTAKWREWNGLQ